MNATGMRSHLFAHVDRFLDDTPQPFGGSTIWEEVIFTLTVYCAGARVHFYPYQAPP